MGAGAVDRVEQDIRIDDHHPGSAPLREAPGERVVFEPGGQPKGFGQIGSGRTEGAGRGVGPWPRITRAESSADSLVQRSLEAQSPFAHRAFHEEARVRVECDGGSHKSIITSEILTM